MKSPFDDSPIELTCPSCGHKFKERIGKLNTNPQLPCPACQSVITIEANSLNTAVKQVDKSMADLRKTGAGFGKKR